ncbi:MAG: DUF4234 domain-containing protein, partial [Miltoncostaeaceae bacterium]
RGMRARTRGPVITWLLLVVTLGIYGLFHWYYINREMRDVSAAMGTPFGNAPGMSVLALFPGGILIVPAIWTWVTTARRARDLRVMALDGRPGEVTSVPLAVLLGFIYGLNHPYLQASLNATYDLAGAERA